MTEPNLQTQSSGGQSLELHIYPNQMQRQEQQTEYNQQYNEQTSDQYQTQPISQTHHKQWQPMQQTYQPQDQSRVPVVIVNQSPRTRNESKRKCYNCLRVLQMIFCALALFVFTGLLIYYSTATLKKQKSNGTERFWRTEERNEAIFWVMIILSFIICGMIGAGGEVLCCQLIHTLVTIWLIPYSVITITLVIGMCNGWNR